MPHCASSYLQRLVFPRFEGITYKRLHEAAQIEEPYFNPDKYRRELSLDDSDILFSNEAVSFMDNGLQNLQRALPEARIIIVIRRQPDWILSAYCHAVCNAQQTSAGLARFIERRLSYLAPNLDYRERLYRLCKLWGGENVLAVAYETLLEDPSAFIGRITSFLNIAPMELSDIRPINAAERGRDVLRLNRALNLVHRPVNGALDAIHRMRRGRDARFRGPADTVEKHAKAALRRGRRRLNGWLRHKLPAPALTRHDVESILAGRLDAAMDGNRAVAEATGLDLGEMGYFKLLDSRSAQTSTRID
jgi:hypothetical protein